MRGLGGAAAAGVRRAGSSYLRWAMAGALPLTAAGVAAAGFKGIGDTKPALYMTAASVALNAQAAQLWDNQEEYKKTLHKRYGEDAK